MSYFRSFLPWIVYATVSSLVNWRAAAALALLVAVRAVKEQRRQHHEVDLLSRTTAWFFFALVIVGLTDPASPLHRFIPALSLAALGAAAAGSLLCRQPFTLVIARRTTPAELWDLPAFVDANVTITAVWTASFLLTAAVCALTLAVAPGAAAVWLAAEIIGFAVPVVFTARYRERIRNRFVAGV